MTKTRPGRERITRQELYSELAQAEYAQQAHILGCQVCLDSSGDVYARCLTWWRQAKTIYRVRRNLQQYEEPETVNMDTLPGMEEL